MTQLPDNLTWRPENLHRYVPLYVSSNTWQHIQTLYGNMLIMNNTKPEDWLLEKKSILKLIGGSSSLQFRMQTMRGNTLL